MQAKKKRRTPLVIRKCYLKATFLAFKLSCDTTDKSVKSQILKEEKGVCWVVF